VNRKVVIVMVLMAGSKSGNCDRGTLRAAGEGRCDGQHSLTLFVSIWSSAKILREQSNF